MKRSEAIEIWERNTSCYAGVHIPGSISEMRMNDDDFESIKLLLSTAKQVEEVVGKLKEDYKALKKKDYELKEMGENNSYLAGELRILDWVIEMLTEEE